MANQESKETLSGGKLDVKAVADQFLLQYYVYLRDEPELLHKFYKDESVLRWEGVESTTLDGIGEIIMASDYKWCDMKILNADVQESLMEGVILAVTGCLLGKDSTKRIISQTFFLAKQEKGFYILNDNFRVLDTQELISHSFDTVESSSVALHASSTHESESSEVPPQLNAVNEVSCMKAAESGEETLQVNVPTATASLEVTVPPAEVTVPTSTASLEVTVPPTEVPKQAVTLAQNDAPPTPSNEKLEGQKISYASMVAKGRKTAFSSDNPRQQIIRVAPSSNQQPVLSHRANIAKGTKERTSYSHGSTDNNSNIHNSNKNIHSEDSTARSVYIENLPKDITKDELAVAVKVFGVARPSGIQIRTCRQDGFCFGFVEFESEASAKSAVETRKLTVKGSEARISFKKSGTRGGGFRPRHFNGQVKGEVQSNGSHRDDLGGRGYDRQNREFGRRNNLSREGRAYGGEAYRRNNGRNGERTSNGGHWVQNEGGNYGTADSAAKA